MHGYMFQPLCGHLQVVKVHKNVNSNCNISYGRSAWNLT